MKKDKEHAIIAGVCAGLARSLGIDALYIRIGFVAAFALFGVGPLAYLILWILMTLDD